jgi:predicted protein tyrosine phosphatase
MPRTDRSFHRNLLFVCAANQDRSPTAERLCAEIPGVSVRSAGLYPGSRSPLSNELLSWTDLVVTMEPWQSRMIRERYPECTAPMLCLCIEDNYTYMSTELVALITAQLPRIHDALDALEAQ